MQHSDFVHLHVHTQYSILDGTNRLEDLFKKAKEFKMPALAMTDHGNMHGAIDFYRQAYKHGIKPIIGCEVYLAPKSRFEKNPGASESARHLILLVKNMTGYKNLMKLSTAAYLEGFYYRPRIDLEILSGHCEGLIALSACLHGEIPSLILKGEREAAQVVAERYREIFGAENFFLELMVNGLPKQDEVNAGLIELGRKLSLPLVATNDCHYLNREDAQAHDILLCIQTGKTIDDPSRFHFSTDQLYFRSPDEMKRLFKEYPESINNTILIAEKCNLHLELGKINLPHFDKEGYEDHDEYLRNLSLSGLEERLSRSGADVRSRREKYLSRLNEELAIIKSKGFAGYFLIVSDFVDYARRRGIPVGPGRGSAAGSLVAYSLGITNIDPIRYGLFFERFLNPDRKTMPDIDIDFCQEGREEVINYVMDKYGHDKVAQIITFGTMKAKAVVRDVGRALGIPYAEVDTIAKLIPNVLKITLDEAIKTEPRLKAEEEKNEKIKRLLDLSKTLEGLIRHSSTHAAGVVISDIPLVERVPLCRNPKDENVMTQFPMLDLEEVGMMKFDFLGLKTLTVIKNTIKFVKEIKGEIIDINNIPHDDKKTFQLLQKAETDGVFQLESPGMKDILLRIKPDSMEDIIALISLYRPGPMKMIPEFIARKNDHNKIDYIVPELKDILAETYGIILYQEQVMQIASVIGNYSLADADNLRKMMSKKKTAEMEREKPKFLEGARKKRIPEEKARKIWEQMETFAEYGFNKSHSTAYGIISYQTAFLKANYPVEFMASLLSSEKDNRDNIIKYINTAKEMGISILPPDINESQSDFSISQGRIRFGLSAVKNVGVNAIDAIIKAREGEGNKFRSFIDVCRRVDTRKVNKKVFESLIKCGAFDSLGLKRRQLAEAYENIIDDLQRKKSLQTSLLDDLDSAGDHKEEDFALNLPDIPEWDYHDLLKNEKETLGFYITGHPLERFADKITLITTTNSANIRSKNDKDTVSIAGMVTTSRELLTKRKEKMAYVTIEDMVGTLEAIVFPDTYRQISHLLLQGEPLLFTGTVDAADEIKLILREVKLLADAVNTPVNSIHFTINIDTYSPDILDELHELIKRHPGNHDAYVHFLDRNTETVVYLGKDVTLAGSKELKIEAEKILGAGSAIFM